MIWGGRRQYWGKLPGDEGSRFPDSVEKGHQAKGQKEKLSEANYEMWMRIVWEWEGEGRTDHVTAREGKSKMQMAKHQDRPMNMIGRAPREDPL